MPGIHPWINFSPQISQRACVCFMVGDFLGVCLCVYACVSNEVCIVGNVHAVNRETLVAPSVCCIFLLMVHTVGTPV